MNIYFFDEFDLAFVLRKSKKKPQKDVFLYFAQIKFIISPF